MKERHTVVNFFGVEAVTYEMPKKMFVLHHFVKSQVVNVLNSFSGIVFWKPSFSKLPPKQADTTSQ